MSNGGAKKSAREGAAHVPEKAPSTKYIPELAKYDEEATAENDEEEPVAVVKNLISHTSPISANFSPAACVDPFDSTAVKMDVQIHRLLSRYEVSALAAYHQLELHGLPTLQQHRLFPMVQTSMQGFFLNKLHAYSVLATVSAVHTGEGQLLVSARRAQYFKYKSIQYMQAYIQSRTDLSVDDAQVILDILFMFASELYVRDYPNALKHMKIASKLLDSLGSSDFDKYIRHGCQASEILLSMETLSAPALPLDWDPGEFPPESWKTIKKWTRPTSQALLQASICGLTCPSLDSILADVAAWSRVYQYTTVYPGQPDLRWANCRGKALMHRLLSLPEIPSDDIGSQAVRLTLIILLGIVLSCIGLLRSGKINAARLCSLLKDCDYLSCAMPEEMALWVLVTGYMVATAGSEEQKWFEVKSASHAKSLGVTQSYQEMVDLMQKYLLLDIHRPNLELLWNAFPQLLELVCV